MVDCALVSTGENITRTCEFHFTVRIHGPEASLAKEERFCNVN